MRLIFLIQKERTSISILLSIQTCIGLIHTMFWEIFIIGKKRDWNSWFEQFWSNSTHSFLFGDVLTDFGNKIGLLGPKGLGSTPTRLPLLTEFNFFLGYVGYTPCMPLTSDVDNINSVLKEYKKYMTIFFIQVAHDVINGWSRKSGERGFRKSNLSVE